jgi:hypothetical protein
MLVNVAAGWWPTRRLREDRIGVGRHRRQVLTGFARIPRVGYRGYVHADVRNRWQKFEGYVAHADEQAEKLTNQPNGTNYDLLAEGYTYVVTLLCNTVVEFVDTDDRNFFVKDDLPRVATPAELRDYLADVDEKDLKALPFAKRIVGG